MPFLLKNTLDILSTALKIHEEWINLNWLLYHNKAFYWVFIKNFYKYIFFIYKIFLDYIKIFYMKGLYKYFLNNILYICGCNFINGSLSYYFKIYVYNFYKIYYIIFHWGPLIGYTPYTIYLLIPSEIKLEIMARIYPANFNKF